MKPKASSLKKTGKTEAGKEQAFRRRLGVERPARPCVPAGEYRCWDLWPGWHCS